MNPRHLTTPTLYLLYHSLPGFQGLQNAGNGFFDYRYVAVYVMSQRNTDSLLELAPI